MNRHVTHASPLASTGAEQVARRHPEKATTTRKRTLNRRGVIWLGQTCNLRCYFCYFIHRIEDAHHPEHPFMELEKAKAICQTLRAFYRCTAVDIQGGEPTIYPPILELVAFCREIGLFPTCITNGIQLAKPGVLEQFRDAGIRDFLVSLQGIGSVHDEVVGRKGAYDKLLTAVGRMRELGIPFRFNCTMSLPVVPQLPEIAQKAVESNARAVNFIAFNPFGDQMSGVRSATNVPRYSAVKSALTPAISLLEEAGIECNVRYLPLCMAEPQHRKNFYNFQQLPYDHHEWDYASWLWTMMPTQMMRDGGLAPAFRIGSGGGRLYRNFDARKLRDLCEAHPLLGRVLFGVQHGAARLEELLRGKERLYRNEARVRAARDCKYQYHEACRHCVLKNICDGFHGDYADFFGTEEAQPITDMDPVVDALHFIRHQDKYVEEEDKPWAL